MAMKYVDILDKISTVGGRIDPQGKMGEMVDTGNQKQDF